MSAGRRRPYIDWARGLAVLIMIQAHVLDAWTRPADRQSLLYRNLVILGGFAAPLFLWLAGVGSALSAERSLARGANRRTAALTLGRRGAEIFALAFLFRFQAFILSPGNPLSSILRVDILNIIGPSLIVAAAIWWAARTRTAAVIAFAAASAAVALATPLIRRASWVDVLPPVLQWYVRPAGTHTTFTLLPWAGFVFAGAGIGLLLVWGSRSIAAREARLHAALAVAGITLAAFGLIAGSRPRLFAGSSFWTTSPEFFVLRIGVLVATLGALYGLERALSDRSSVLLPLERLGRASLFVYWIHVEMVYGYLSWPIRRGLSVPQAGVAYAAFCLFIYGLVVLWESLSWPWRHSGSGPPESTGAFGATRVASA
jgi:uncharacterized membrane protein